MEKMDIGPNLANAISKLINCEKDKGVDMGEVLQKAFGISFQNSTPKVLCNVVQCKHNDKHICVNERIIFEECSLNFFKCLSRENKD